jgi:hypothetical protein
MGPEWADPKTIQHWPGKLRHEICNKVATDIAYDIHTGEQSSWGFLCNSEDDADRYEVNSLFKLCLDPNHKDPTPVPLTIEDAKRWYLDYMRCLYDYVLTYLRDSIPHFSSKRVECVTTISKIRRITRADVSHYSFVFSIPVTWKKDPAMLAQIELLLHTAGFGSRPNETMSISLTEAEAAAISAAKGSMRKGDVFLIVDAGGGTTDLNVLRVEATGRAKFELLPLSWTEGSVVGSTIIDYKIRTLIKGRLELVQEHVPGDIEDTARQMMQDSFESFKCSFGSSGMDVPRLNLSIPGMENGLDFPHVSIEGSRMIITR